MNKEQYLFYCLMEESAEVIQAVCKIARFGKNDIKWGRKQTNLQRLNAEVNDFIGALEMLRERFPDIKIDPEKVELKKAKIKKYLEYSRKIGQVDAEK